VIRDNKKIQGPHQLGLHAVVSRYLLAACEAIGVCRSEIEVAHHARIGRVGRVQVGVAPEHPLREAPVNEW